MQELKQQIEAIRSQYRRGLRTEEEAIQGFADVYAETFGMYSAIYQEMKLCNFEECFGDYKRKNEKEVINMSNQAIIENLLDMWLDQKQLARIENGWKAFYNNPLAYKGTIVVEMVKKFVMEV